MKRSGTLLRKKWALDFASDLGFDFRVDLLQFLKVVLKIFALVVESN